MYEDGALEVLESAEAHAAWEAHCQSVQRLVAKGLFTSEEGHRLCDVQDRTRWVYAYLSIDVPEL